jgi:hypothetical protein
MEKKYKKLVWGLFLGLVWATPSAQAQPSLPSVLAVSMHTPLMIIRFNQQRVFYKKSLYTALSKAISVKPSVMFNLVSYVPRSGDAVRDERLLVEANAHLREVIGQMRQMGVPQSQISVNNELEAGLRHDEIHIFVH